MGAVDRIKHAWNAFVNQDQDRTFHSGYGGSYGSRPDRVRLRMGNERSIISSIYTRMALDFSMIDFRHVRLDDNDRYLEDMRSRLNECLNLEANIDQTSDFFFQDFALTMFEEGTAVIVPIDITDDPEHTNSFDILSWRVGTVVQFYPRHVKVDVYNDQTGRHEQITLEKRFVAVVENPLYNVMNEQNSTLQRLIRKLNVLDVIDEQAASGKLDLIIQLPYSTKGEVKRQQAAQRRGDLEDQLQNSKYGIGYADANEKVIQLNRPAENNLLATVEYLFAMLYGQLGITPGIMDGTADEQTMLNYLTRTIGPSAERMAQEMRRKFLTRTARSQKQSILYFRDPFSLIPISNIAEIADKFTRNEIATSNDMRQVIGWKPSKDPKADELRNSNIARPYEEGAVVQGEVVSSEPDTGMFDEVNQELDKIFGELGASNDSS